MEKKLELLKEKKYESRERIAAPLAKCVRELASEPIKYETLDILLVEDTEEYKEAALKVLGKEKKYKIETASTYSEAKEKIEKREKEGKPFDFVLIDFFFPYSTKEVDKEGEDYLRKVYIEFGTQYLTLADFILSWSGGPFPLGYKLAEELKEKGKKYMIVTAGDSHCEEMRRISSIIEEKGLESYVERESYYEEKGVKASEEYWRKVYEKMQRLIR